MHSACWIKHGFCRETGHVIKSFLFLGVLDVQKDTELNIHRYFLILGCFAVQFTSTRALQVEVLAGILPSTVWTP